MADKLYTEEEVQKILQALVAQQQSGSGQLGGNLLSLQPTPGVAPSTVSQQQSNSPPFIVTPQGFGGLPGAGAFGPQGVLFAGGSPWPVSSQPAQIANLMSSLNYSLDALKKSGVLDQLFKKK